MSKKELKERIKELEAENLLLRALAMNPAYVYIYLYRGLPYRHYWQYQGWQPLPVTCEPEWTYKPDNHTWVVGGDTNKYIVGDSGKYEIGCDWANGNEMTVTATGTVTVVN